MNIRDYSYELPRDRIAQTPAQPRDSSRLLLLRKGGGEVRDLAFRDLAGCLEPGDLLVVNDTRVIAARLKGRKETGGSAEVLLLARQSRSRWEALVRASGRLRAGTRIFLGQGASIVVADERGEGVFDVEIETQGDPLAAVEELGETPLPPYIRREAPDPRDRAWYQTVFARPDTGGSAAAPTAGLHFTEEVIQSLTARGVERASVTLHVGLGTFLPVRSERLEDHSLHREWYHVPEETARAVNRAIADGRRVIAVGTTATRVLEHCGESGALAAGSGWTDLFIREGHPFRVVGGLITNFHLPESTLLVLVCAFAGRERVLAAYRRAVEAGYRFYSYGDAMLIL